MTFAIWDYLGITEAEYIKSKAFRGKTETCAKKDCKNKPVAGRVLCETHDKEFLPQWYQSDEAKETEKSQ